MTREIHFSKFNNTNPHFTLKFRNTTLINHKQRRKFSETALKQCKIYSVVTVLKHTIK